MDIKELRDKTSALKKEKQSFINDTYFWVNIAREAVNELPNNKIKFDTPKANNPQVLRTVSRSDTQKLKNRIIDKDILNSAFVIIVANVEDYFSKVMEWILKTDNQRIKFTSKDINMDTSVPIIELIDESKEDIINRIINLRINKLFYAGPKKQLEYFDKALSIKIDDDIWGKWVEIKARRDLIVHNNSIVNNIYLEKSQQYALFELGEEATIDFNYFTNIVSLLKSLIGKIDREIRKVYQLK